MTRDRQVEYASYPSLRGRVVVVTGGASGIGEKIVGHFARQGARVTFLDIQKNAGMQLAKKIRTGGDPEPCFLRCDLTDTDALRKCIDKTIAKFKTVDVLVNNAANDARHAVQAVTPEYWDQIDLCQSQAPVLRQPGGDSGDEESGSRVHHQHELYQLDDPIRGPAGIYHGEGCDCWTHAHPGP